MGLGAWDFVGIGGIVVGSVVSGLVLGYVLDSLTGTSPVFVLIGLAAGVILGGIVSWLRIRPFLNGSDHG
ncbi:AtpZ/AtpI family protein [Rudaeicoccus suwonensis]|nr:AtpZ/AtpI family protein [Rudaeicoccus suwonensis]